MREQVELDRLADYAAGLLDGTPAGDQIAALIATDPAWSGAHAELLAADQLVGADLAALGASREPMPADVVARLTGALAAEGRGDRTVVSLDARRRRKRWTAVAAVAAGVVAFGIFGLPLLRSDGGPASPTSLSNRSGAGAAAGAPTPAPPAPGESGLIVRVSGMDYGRDTKWTAPGALSGDAHDQDAEKTAAAPIPTELSRLGDSAGRQACLTAIIRVYGGRPQSVDYARFEGAPALIVVLADERGRPVRLVAAGPDCGLDGNPDVRHAAPIS